MLRNTCYDENSLAQTLVNLAGFTPISPRAVSGLAGPGWVDALEANKYSEALKSLNDLRDRLLSKMAKQNATPKLETILQVWKTKHQLDPIKFYWLMLIFQTSLPGKRPPMAEAREHALHLLRPDLFCREGVSCEPSCKPTRNLREFTHPLARQMRNERQSLTKKLKDAMAKPSSALAPIFEQIRKDWNATLKATCDQLGLDPTPDTFRKLTAECLADELPTH